MWLMLTALNLTLLVTGGAADPARTAGAISSVDVRLRETSMGDLVADAIKQQAKADAALVSAAQFRPGTVGPGRVTAADISALLVKPGRKWVVSKISGRALLAAMERALSRAPEASAHFLQVSGIRVRYDPGAPAGHRVKTLRIKGQAVQPSVIYRVAMPEDLAKGASGYFTIPEFNESTIQPGPTGTLAEALGQLLEQKPALDYTNLNRIVAVAEETSEGS